MAENQGEPKENDLGDFDPSSICLDMKKLVRAEYGLAKARAFYLIRYWFCQINESHYLMAGWKDMEDKVVVEEVEHALTWLTFHTKSRYDPETEMIWLED